MIKNENFEKSSRLLKNCHSLIFMNEFIETGCFLHIGDFAFYADV